MKYIVVAALAASALSSGSALAANLLVNGSFESGPNPGSFSTFNATSTAITGWTLTNGSIDYIGSYWTASNGSRSLDLVGCCATAGTIAQTFNTVAGKTYKVTFDLWANPDGGAPYPRLAYANVGAGNLTFSSNGGGSNAAPNWLGNSFSFVAGAGPTTTLSFSGDLASSTGSAGVAYGAALDNVSVTVPEPASWALMIAGFGLVGAATRRRSKVQVTYA
jgi:choice-of-anchor C domain-containing protein